VKNPEENYLPLTTPGCSIIKIARFDDVFLKVFQLQAIPVEGQSLPQKEKKRRKRKGQKFLSKIKKPKDVGHFLLQNFNFSACLSQNVIKRDASGKNSKLSCCKCICDQIKANLAEIQPEKRQNVQKYVFFQKAPGVKKLKVKM